MTTCLGLVTRFAKIMYRGEHMKERLAAYKGNDPYTFISYAHKDFNKVHEILCELNKMGFNIWYDEGIDPGNEWADEIADALYNSKLFIVFVSANSMSSRNVINECFYALDNGIPYLAVFLEDVSYTKGLSLRASSTQAIMKFRQDDESFYKKASQAMKMMLADNYIDSPEQAMRYQSRKKPKNLLIRKLSMPVIVMIVIGLIFSVSYSIVMLTDLASELNLLKITRSNPEPASEEATDVVSVSENLSVDEPVPTVPTTIESIASEPVATAPKIEAPPTTIATAAPTASPTVVPTAPPATTIAPSNAYDYGFGTTEYQNMNDDFVTLVYRNSLPNYAQRITRVSLGIHHGRFQLIDVSKTHYILPLEPNPSHFDNPNFSLSPKRHPDSNRPLTGSTVLAQVVQH